MKFLRLPLYIILFACGVWASIFFSGASVVTYLVKLYFDDKIKIHNVHVTPHLEIKISRLEFNFPTHKGGDAIVGFARSLELEWSIFTKTPSITLLLGPTQIDGKGNLETASLNLFVKNWSDFWKPSYALKSIEMNLSELISIETVELTGKLNLTKSIMSDSQVSFNNVEIVKPNFFSTPHIAATIEDYHFKVPIEEQDLSLKIQADNIQNNLGEAIVASLESELKFSPNDINFNTSIQDFNYNNEMATFERARVSVNYSDINEFNNFNATFTFEEFQAPEMNLNSPRVYGSLMVLDNGAKLEVAGKIKSFDLSADGQFIAQIRNGNFSMNIDTVPSNEGIAVNGGSLIKFTPNESPYVDIELEAEVRGARLPLECIFILCEMAALELGYTLDVNNEKLFGRSNCPGGACFTGSSAHDLETVNTAEFFRALSGAKIVNPFYLGFAYSQLMQGVKRENGHKLSIR